MKSCGNCLNYIWGDDKTPIPDVCIKCQYIEGVEGKVPSNWKPQPMSNADRIRSMSDEELADLIQEAELCGKEGASIADCGMTTLEWLRKPVEEVAE